MCLLKSGIVLGAREDRCLRGKWCGVGLLVMASSCRWGSGAAYPLPLNIHSVWRMNVVREVLEKEVPDWQVPSAYRLPSSLSEAPV